MKRVLASLTGLLLASTLCAAQAPATIPGVNASEVDLSVPESPAFAALGVTPENVLRPASPRALASSILNGVDPNGNFQSGFALDTAPYFLAYGSKIRLGDYTGSYAVRFLSRLQLSLASAKGMADDDKGTRLALGLRITPWDAGDYRMNKEFLKELDTLWEEAGNDPAVVRLRPTNPADPNFERLELAYNTAREERARGLLAPIKEKYRKQNWNASGLSLGIAPTWFSADGTTNNLVWNGGVAWASLAYGFGSVPGLRDSAQFIVHGRYRNRDHVPVPDSDGEYYLQDSSLVGARGRFGSVDGNASFEFVYLHANPKTLPSDTYLRFTGGAERRIVENLWLELSIGTESGKRDGNNHLLFMTNFKWALNRKE